MNNSKLEIKLTYISGLREIVLAEIKQFENLHLVREGEDSLYLDFISDLTIIKKLRSITRAYIVVRNIGYNPYYLSKHKSILGDLVEIIVGANKKLFKTFKITCAGSDSTEVKNIAGYIQKTYQLLEQEEADLKIHLVKLSDFWEVGVQITPKPLSVRDYKIKNMSGAMDPTIAYAVNSLCELEKADTYLNIFSGSATLLIEAGLSYPNLKHLIGFDNNKKHLSLAMQNIKQAGLIEKIQLKEKDIFTKPDLGKFEVITSDLPFGMVISKNENLESLYQSFIEYCGETLSDDGRMVVYTSEHELLKKIILASDFKIVKNLDLKFMTSANSYLYPKIFYCQFK